MSTTVCQGNSGSQTSRRMLTCSYAWHAIKHRAAKEEAARVAGELAATKQQLEAQEASSSYASTELQRMRSQAEVGR